MAMYAIDQDLIKSAYLSKFLVHITKFTPF